MKLTRIVMLMIALAITSTGVFAAYTWDGSAFPAGAWTAGNAAAFTYDYQGLGYMRQYTDFEEAYLRFNGTTELVRANGWFVETKLKVTLPTSLNATARLSLGDEMGGSQLTFSNTEIRGYNAADDTDAFTVPWIANDWNVVRATMPAGGSAIEVRVNGDLVGTMSTSSNSWWNSVVTLGSFTGGGSESDVAWDYLNMNFEVQGVLTGQITLDEYVGSLELAPVLVQLVPTSGGAAKTERVDLGAGGSYSVVNVVPGTYDVYFSACKWLTKKVSPVVVTAGPVQVSPVLKNGDSNGDNEVDTTDLSVSLVNIDQQGDVPPSP